jgi:hypothetical protein
VWPLMLIFPGGLLDDNVWHVCVEITFVCAGVYVSRRLQVPSHVAMHGRYADDIAQDTV